jgi:hypothetical protein
MDTSSIDKKINELYKDYDGWQISSESIKKLSYFHRSMKYDEASTESFLNALFITKPQINDIFLDLGSGLGKKVIATSLLDTISKSVGIELLQGLYDTSNLIKNKIEKNSILTTNMEFILGDYYNIDFSYASIVHISISPIMIRFQLEGTLENKLKQLKKGTRVIISEVQIPFKEFSLIKNIDYVFPSRIEKAYIYEKIH